MRDQTGEKNSQWKGGIRVSKEGYHFTRRPEHPHNRHGYVPNHRLIMEQYLSIIFDEEVFIPSFMDVHHIDENKGNNALINLELLPHGKHMTLHNYVDDSDRLCSACGSNKTNIRDDGRRNWGKDGNGGWLCHKCKCKEYRRKQKINKEKRFCG